MGFPDDVAIGAPDPDPGDNNRVSKCLNCGWAGTYAVDACPTCGTRTVRVPGYLTDGGEHRFGVWGALLDHEIEIIKAMRRIDPAIKSHVLLTLIELEQVSKHHPPMQSPQEGYAVILEELDEAWDEIKRRNGPNTYDEMTQVAAMALRYLLEVGKDAR